MAKWRHSRGCHRRLVGSCPQLPTPGSATEYNNLSTPQGQIKWGQPGQFPRPPPLQGSPRDDNYLL